MTTAQAIRPTKLAPMWQRPTTGAMSARSRAAGQLRKDRASVVKLGLASGDVGVFRGAIEVRGTGHEDSTLSGAFLVLDKPVVIDGRMFSELHLGFRAFAPEQAVELRGRVQVSQGSERASQVASLSYITTGDEPRYTKGGKWASANGDTIVKIADTAGLQDGGAALVVLIDIIAGEAHVGFEGGPVQRGADVFHGFVGTGRVSVPTHVDRLAVRFDLRGRLVNARGEVLRKMGQAIEGARGTFGTTYYFDATHQKIYALTSAGARALPEVTHVIELPTELVA